MGRTRAFLDNLERKHNPQLAAELDAKDVVGSSRPQTSSRLTARRFESPAATAAAVATTSSASKSANVQKLRLPRASSASGARLISRGGQVSPGAHRNTSTLDQQQQQAAGKFFCRSLVYSSVHRRHSAGVVQQQATCACHTGSILLVCLLCSSSARSFNDTRRGSQRDAENSDYQAKAPRQAFQAPRRPKGEE